MENSFESKKAVISLSGGLDSTCLLLKLLADGYDVRAYSFDYGQKHEVELKKVKKNIKFLKSKGLPLTHQIINLRDVFSDSASSLHKGGDDIPHGMYDQDNMKSTVVENRNIIFSAIIYGKALAWANQTSSNVVITQGLHAGDHCFTGDTKILTPIGYKTIDTLKVGDLVYSLDPETGAIIEDKCLDVISKGTNNTIYNIKTTSGTVRLTSEHNVYVVEYGDLDRSGFDKTIVKKKVKDLNVGDIMLTSCKLPNIKSNTCNTINVTDVVKDFLNNMGCTLEEDDGMLIPISSNGKKMTPYPAEMNSKALLNIIAWYITEGSTSSAKNTNSSRFLSSFVQSAYKNLENCESINEDLNTLNIPISSTNKKMDNGMIKEITYQFNSVMSILMQTCGEKSINKHIPNWIMDYLITNPANINEFLYTLVSGDGHYDNLSGMYSFQSKSKELLEQVAFLAKLSGYYVKVTYGNNTNTITFASKCRKQGLVRYGDGAMTKITDIVIDESKSEKVYDISVEKNHNFFAGDFGNVLISNSIYPDCRPESQEMARELYKISNWGSERVDFIAPFINIHKGAVLREGLDAMKKLEFTWAEINKVLRNTHTCYDPNDKGESCGLCGSCTERIEAFAFNLMEDPAKYSLTKDELNEKYAEAYARLEPQN